MQPQSLSKMQGNWRASDNIDRNELVEVVPVIFKEITEVVALKGNNDINNFF